MMFIEKKHKKVAQLLGMRSKLVDDLSTLRAGIIHRLKVRLSRNREYICSNPSKLSIRRSGRNKANSTCTGIFKESLNHAHHSLNYNTIRSNKTKSYS